MTAKEKVNEALLWTTVALGAAALAFAIVRFPFSIVDNRFLWFTAAAIVLTTFLQVQLPRTKIHFTISDSVIFVALLLYGGEVGIVVAAVESVYTSLNLKRKGVPIGLRTLLLNCSIASVATLVTVIVARTVFPSIKSASQTTTPTEFVTLMCLMVGTQFLVNSLFVAVFAALRSDRPIWKVWYEYCFNALLMFLTGGFLAAIIIKALDNLEPVLIAVALGVAVVVFLTYRRYIEELKSSSAKAEQSERDRAEQAERHIEELQHYIREQEKTSGELRESREKYRHAAFHDQLTDLPNRSLFIETLKFLLEKFKHTPNRTFAVLSLDLNRFKTINESLGHSVGDRLISHVAKRLTSMIRENDLVARFSGDAFGIILSNIRMADDAVQFAQLIHRRIQKPFTIAGRQVFTDASIGISICNVTYEDAEDILRDADIAMYHAKENDKDHIVFDQTMHLRAVTLLQLETDLRSAIERNELSVFYQPIVDLATMKLNGFEALMRWNHPQRGIIPPSEFIPVAEETGLIVPLTLWILQKACAQTVEWQNRDPENASLMISVNLSGKHFAHSDMVEQVRRIIVETTINPATLKLEITESAVMENAETAIALLKNLRALGLQLSIDDFGTGYSSFSYLHRFPIDMLKVDRSFVGSMEDGTENGEIVRTVIALGKTLGLNIVAEGIETIHQLHQLRILGCEYGQGYLFSRPVPVDEATTVLDDKSRWQNIIPDNNPAVVAQNREFSRLRLAK
ncbi:MAG: EAL domain-containing protein [Acidobacteria bacterium]|nr:EAL domain-containing protein [Acidobacteriota bacterium]